MDLDPLLLSRIQFAANISFHILFPTITIGLAWILLFFRLRYTYSNDQIWENAYQFWVKIFALTFAIGVVTGITMSFQFGTNWPGFMERVGNIAGPLLAYLTLYAFLMVSYIGALLYLSSKPAPALDSSPSLKPTIWSVSNGIHVTGDIRLYRGAGFTTLRCTGRI